jgi:cell division protein FtsA
MPDAFAALHLVDAAETSLRNLGACLMRCDLEVAELVAAPFAAGLATLVEDEKQLGCTVSSTARCAQM